jgi:hypothetical protein
MDILLLLTKGQDYLLLVVFVMMTVGIIKEHALFNSMFYYIKKSIKSNRAVVALLSGIGGLLPISGRVTVSAGLLDTIAPMRGQKGRENYGIVDYLSTHHYYMWSPLEKTILVPMAAFGLTYTAVVGMLWPLLAVSLVMIFAYIFFYIKEGDVVITQTLSFDFKISEIIRNVMPMILAVAAIINGVSFIWAFGLLTFYYCLLTQTWDIKKLLSYVNWGLVLLVAALIVFANFARGHEAEITEFIKNSSFDMSTTTGVILVSLTAFLSGLILGSSGRFIALAIILTQIYGMDYFVWFFALEFAGYLLSPAHKCVGIGKSYFGTPITKYMLVLSLWGLLVVATAGIMTFVL